MKNKILLTILMSAKLFASSTNHMDPQLKDLYDNLSYQNIMLLLGEVSDDFKLHNIDALGAFTQGTDSSLQTLVKGLKPYNVFKKSITLQSLSEEVKAKFLGLPNMPQEIKETTENLCVHAFAYAAEAFGKEIAPLFIYATRQVEANDVSTINIEDFNYTDSLTRYRQICSMIRLFPFDHLEDEAEKFNCLKSLASIGIIEAQFNCGNMLDKGEGVNQDKAETFKYYKLAADQGLMEAQFNCGVMLENGKGMTQDKAEAFRYYKLAADQGDEEAQNTCGLMLDNGEGVTQNKAEAFKYLKLAANQGLKEAQYNCGVMLEKGEGVTQDKVEAFKYFKLAADQGLIKAQFNCGVMLYHGQGVNQDKAEAFKYCKLAANQGYAESIKYLKEMEKKD